MSTPAQPSWFTRNEIPRKVLHGFIAIMTTWLYLRGVQITEVVPYLVAALIPIAILEWLRFNFGTINKLYIAVCGPLMRKEEKEEAKINGVVWYLVGLITVFVFFPKDVCFLAVFLLSWADLAASSIGRAYGHYSIKIIGSKSLIGTLAAFCTGVLCTYLVYDVLLPLRPEYNSPTTLILFNRNLSRISVSRLALIMGGTVALAELFPVIDDNLSIPIVCAVVHYLVVNHFSLPYTYGVFES